MAKNLSEGLRYGIARIGRSQNRKDLNNVGKYPLKCIAGDDAYLMYYYLCNSCETVVMGDGNGESSPKESECPSCDPQENFPFQYFTKKQIAELEIGIPSIGIDKSGNLVKGEMSLVDRLRRGRI